MEGDGQDTKLKHAQNQVAKVKEVMMENIGKVVDRGERLEVLGERAEELQGEAKVFHGKAVSARRHFWWQKCKMQLLILLIVLIVLIALVLGICYTGGRNNCTKK